MAVTIKGKSRMRPELKRMAFSGSMLGSSKKEHSEDNSPLTSSDDPLRILAPGQKKLTTIESKRVLAVMDKAIKRLDCALLLPYLASDISRFSVSLGEELVGLLEEYNHLMNKYYHLFNSLELEQLSPMDSFSSQVGLYEPGLGLSSMSGSSRRRRSSSYTAGHPVQLDSLNKETIESMEAKFQQVRFRLRMNVKCILRELGTSPFPYAMSSMEKPRNTSVLQDDIR